MKIHSNLKGLACIFVYLSISSSPSWATPSDCTHSNDEFKCVQYKKNYDADTIKFDIPHSHPLLGQDVSVNLKELYVPSPNSKKKCEKNKGKQARDFTKKELKSAKIINISNLSKKRGKLYGEVIYDGKSLKTELIKNKMANNSKINWCE